MLNVYFGDMPGVDVIENVSVYFKNTYLDTWLEDEFVQRMVKSVDKSIVRSGNLVESPVLGMIGPTQLSGGCKALILMYYRPDIVVNASNCGDNCAWWILRIAAKHDLTINLRHLMVFGNGRFTIRVLNSGNVVHDMLGLIDEYDDAARECVI